MNAEHRHDLVRRLFALLTGKLEDAAALAADGQAASLTPAGQIEHAVRLRAAGEEVVLLADIIHLILTPGNE